MARLKLVTGKDYELHENADAAPTVFGVMYKTTGLIMPGGSIDLTIVPWSRIDSFTFTDHIPDDMAPADADVQ